MEEPESELGGTAAAVAGRVQEGILVWGRAGAGASHK